MILEKNLGCDFMKKIFRAFILLAIICISNNCFAEISKEISLGGIKLGMSYQEVISMYGEPTLKYERVDDKGRVWDKFIEYNDTLQVGFTADNNGDFGVVKNVFVTANNGFSLPSGIKVGSKESDFKKIYSDVKSHGKGKYGLYYTVEISKNELITYSVPDIGNNDKITSLQINKSSPKDRFDKERETSHKLRYIK